jgi:hypothetical protein
LSALFFDGMRTWSEHPLFPKNHTAFTETQVLLADGQAVQLPGSTYKALEYFTAAGGSTYATRYLLQLGGAAGAGAAEAGLPTSLEVRSLAAVLTEIYLCGVCSCQEVLRRNGAAGAFAGSGLTDPLG